MRAWLISTVSMHDSRSSAGTSLTRRNGPLGDVHTEVPRR